MPAEQGASTGRAAKCVGDLHVAAVQTELRSSLLSWPELPKHTGSNFDRTPLPGDHCFAFPYSAGPDYAVPLC